MEAIIFVQKNNKKLKKINKYIDIYKFQQLIKLNNLIINTQ